MSAVVRLSAVALAAAAPIAKPADPAEAAVRLAPPDAAVCLVVRDLRGHVRALDRSPLAAGLGADAGPQVDHLRAVAKLVAGLVGVTPGAVLDDVIGDAVVFAYRPGPADRPDDESGLALVNPANPDTLDKLVARLNDLQLLSGEYKAVRRRAHGGKPYTARERPGGAEFYAARDGVWAFSGQEDAIRGFLDRDPAADPGPWAGLARLGLTDKAVALWVRPRAFDAELRRKAADAGPKEQAFLAQFGRLWAAADGLAVFAHPTGRPTVGGTAGFDRHRVPADLAPVLFPPPGASAAWAAVPADALAAVGGRLDLPAGLAALQSFLPPAGRAGLAAAVADGLGPVVGRHRLGEVLKGVGPDWAAWVSPPDAGGWLPAWAVAVRLAPGVERPVAQAVDFGFQLARVAYNREHDDQIDLGDDGPVRYLANPDGFPAGLRPAFAVKDGYLVVASSPAQVGRFRVAAADPDPPLARVSGPAVRSYLRRHRDPLADALATPDRPAADVAQELAGLAEALAVVDRLEVRYAAAGGQVTLTAAVDLVRGGE